MVKTFDEAYELLKPYPSDFFMSIMLAQWALESDYGRSELALMANNFTGHKTTGWTGEVYRKDTIEDDGTGKKFVAKSEPFRKYASAEEWAKHHASWLQRLPDTYAKAINAKTVEAQAKALQGTYATDTAYAKKLMGMIKENNLTRYDKKESVQMTFPKPAMVDRRKRALGYPSSGAYAKRSLASIKSIVRHYTATKHEGDGENIIKNHEGYWRKTHGWDIGGYHFYIDRQGKIFWNYDMEIVSYGAGKLNPQLVHFSMEANSVASYTGAQKKSEKALILWLMQYLNIPASEVKGHKEIPYNSTRCPGYNEEQLQDYRNQLAKELKAGATPSDSSNPQGLKEFDTVAYKEPRLPFDALKVGDKVTLSENWSWYNPSSKRLMKSNRYDELIGSTDTIAEIIEVTPANHSVLGYKLKDLNSIILQEYVDESKGSWELVPSAPIETPEEIKQKYEELQEGEYIDNDGVIWVWKKK